MVKIIKNNIILAVALAAAGITMIFVPPDSGYLEYFDLGTLTCLFCTLAVVNALKNIHFFQRTAERIVSVFKNTRSATLALVYITFIGSMIMANDMALLTFLPLGYFVLDRTGHKEIMAFVFIMQNIAANLGGMLTPFGNPQNLYMYSYFKIPTMEFLRIMLVPFLLSMLMITVCCLFVKKEPLTITANNEFYMSKKRLIYYIILFVISISVVFRVVPYYVGLIIVFLGVLIADREALFQVDYPLLLTFCAFFVFAGNMARIPAVSEFLSFIVNKNPLIVGVLSCQIISNVPSAVLLSKFCTDYAPLLVAVNIGGAGSLIASLASLITFRKFSSYEPGKIKMYIKYFSIYNFSMLFILVITELFIL